jgi:folylpolyglutamate synthase
MITIFCWEPTDLTAVALAPADIATLSPQQRFASAWLSLVPAYPPSSIHVVASIEHAVNVIQKLGADTNDNIVQDILVVGSLHLVGGVMEVAGLSEVAL